MNNIKVNIKEVDKDNWYECCALEVLEEQKNCSRIPFRESRLT